MTGGLSQAVDPVSDLGKHDVDWADPGRGWRMWGVDIYIAGHTQQALASSAYRHNREEFFSYFLILVLFPLAYRQRNINFIFANAERKQTQND